MLTMTGNLRNVERKPWKTPAADGSIRETVYAVFQDGGYFEKVEVDRSLHEAVDGLVGRYCTGPVRVFKNYDEKLKRVFTRVVLMSVEPVSAPSSPVAA